MRSTMRVEGGKKVVDVMALMAVAASGCGRMGQGCGGVEEMVVVCTLILGVEVSK